MCTLQTPSSKTKTTSYVCKVAENAQDAVYLIELGFEYVACEYDDGGKLFKKKKLLYLGSQN
jgi:hypothetical protein